MLNLSASHPLDMGLSTRLSAVARSTEKTSEAMSSTTRTVTPAGASYPFRAEDTTANGRRRKTIATTSAPTTTRPQFSGTPSSQSTVAPSHAVASPSRRPRNTSRGQAVVLVATPASIGVIFVVLMVFRAAGWHCSVRTLALPAGAQGATAVSAVAERATEPRRGPRGRPPSHARLDSSIRTAANGAFESHEQILAATRQSARLESTLPGSSRPPIVS